MIGNGDGVRIGLLNTWRDFVYGNDDDMTF